MHIIKLTEYEFDNYSKTHQYHSYYQTSAYATVMDHSALKPLYLGFYDEDKLVGATLILSKPVIMGFKYGYAPRGILVDYTNYFQIIEITKELKNYLFKDRYVLLKIDPLLVINKYDKNNKLIYTYEHKDNIMETLKEAGFHYCGASKSFESVKPRWIACLNLDNSLQDIFKNFKKPIRNKIKKATKFGVEITKDNHALEQIYPFISKDGIYSKEYYQTFMNSFQNNIDIYVAKLNTEKYVDSSRLFYEKEMEYNDYLNNIISRDGYKGKNMKDILTKKMESDKLLITYKNYMVESIDLLKQYPEGIIIAGAIVIKDNATLRLLIDGYNHEYGKLCPLYLLKWEIIKEYCQSSFKDFDMNAITSNEIENNPYKGLNDVKYGFGTIGYEYIGEFNLIVNNPMYALYKSIMTNDSIKDNKNPLVQLVVFM